MIEKIKDMITEPLLEQGIFIDSISFGEEDGEKTLFIKIDSKDVVDINMCVKASNIINPLIDTLDIYENNYVVDVSSKGSDE